jgi:hypothetical protein
MKKHNNNIALDLCYAVFLDLALVRTCCDDKKTFATRNLSRAALQETRCVRCGGVASIVINTLNRIGGGVRQRRRCSVLPHVRGDRVPILQFAVLTKNGLFQGAGQPPTFQVPRGHVHRPPQPVQGGHGHRRQHSTVVPMTGPVVGHEFEQGEVLKAVVRWWDSAGRLHDHAPVLTGKMVIFMVRAVAEVAVQIPDPIVNDLAPEVHIQPDSAGGTGAAPFVSTAEELDFRKDSVDRSAPHQTLIRTKSTCNTKLWTTPNRGWTLTLPQLHVRGIIRVGGSRKVAILQ